MKKINFLCVGIIFIIVTQVAFSQNSVYRSGVFLYNKFDKGEYNNNYKELTTLAFSDGKLILVKKINLYDTRLNPDNSIFYRTTLAIIIDKGNDAKISEIETVLYTTKSFDIGLTPCMVFDPQKNVVTIFAGGKDSESSNYGMEGYAYRIDMNNQSWSKEKVFDGENSGFFSFFGGSDNGNPILWHFSFGGYYAKKNARYSNGTWSNSNEGHIKPDVASNQYYNHKNILITSSAYADRMTGIDGSNSNSNSSNSLSENEMAIGAALILGTVLWQGAKWLVNNSGSSSSSSYSSSSNSSSTSTVTKENIRNFVAEITMDYNNDERACYKVTFTDKKYGYIYYSHTRKEYWNGTTVALSYSIGSTQEEAILWLYKDKHP